MRGQGISVMPITAGCRKDIECLLKTYKEKGTLRYKPFIDLFGTADFATIFMGRISPAELYEFSEKLLQIAISYAMSYRQRKPAEYAEESTSLSGPISVSDVRSSNEMALQMRKLQHCYGAFEIGEKLSVNRIRNLSKERVFGIYLTYALYFVQPENYVAQVRVTPDQISDLVDFVNECLIPERHIDAFTALFKLINGGAFRICAFDKEHNPLLHRRFDLSELDEGGLDVVEDEDCTFFKALGDDIVLTQADIICKKYLAAKKKANLPSDLDINLVQTTVSDIYNRILKSTEVENDANSSPKKIRYNSGRFRSALKERAYKSHVIHARHRRHLIDPSVLSANEENGTQQNVVSAAELLKTLKRYVANDSEISSNRSGKEGVLSPRESESSIATREPVSEASGSKTTRKGVCGKRRKRGKPNILEMSLSELKHDLGQKVAVADQEKLDIMNSKKERIADRLLHKIQLAHEKSETSDK